MPEFVVVRCAQCSVFQVRQRPKSGKFKCNMCQFPQTLQKVCVWLWVGVHMACRVRACVDRSGVCGPVWRVCAVCVCGRAGMCG